MMTAIFAVAAIVCVVGWIIERISLLAMLWYIKEKKIPFPSSEEIKKGARWAMKHLIRRNSDDKKTKRKGEHNMKDATLSIETCLAIFD